MWKYIATRAVHSVLVVIAASMIVFALSHLTGDPTPLMLPADATPEMIARYLMTIANGLAVQASGGVTREDLQRVADAALRNWPPV